MARPQSEARAGFYPASTKAIAQLAKHLYSRPPNPDKLNETTQIIDPCAGEGLAVRQLAEVLAIPNHRVYCVELDTARTAAIKENIPGAPVIGPASFIGGVSITGCSFGVVYLNPPFSDEMGGGKREEETFCRHAFKLLAPTPVNVQRS